MKKLTTIVAALVLLFSASAFTVKDVNVSAKVIKGFETDFTTVTDVKWAIKDDVYVATFKENGNEVAAAYDEDGHLLASAKYLKSSELPAKVCEALKNKYGKCSLDNTVIEVNTGETSYLLNVENDKYKMKVEAGSAGYLTVVSKTKK